MTSKEINAEITEDDMELIRDALKFLALNIAPIDQDQANRCLILSSLFTTHKPDISMMN
tara:strand:- start:50 stop:226 length:177 start_codon:yes stop_codon:yes gene_type:complete